MYIAICEYFGKTNFAADATRQAAIDALKKEYLYECSAAGITTNMDLFNNDLFVKYVVNGTFFDLQEHIYD